MRVTKKVVYNFIIKEFPKAFSDFREGESSFRVNSFFVEDTGRHLYIFTNGGNFRCFKSGQSGDFIWLVKNFKNIKGSKETVEKYIYKNYYNATDEDLKERLKNINLNEDTPYKRNGEIPELKEIALPEGSFPLVERTDISEKFLKYLFHRGLKAGVIKKFKLHYCIYGNYANRVIIPVIDDNKIVYFMSRDITNQSAKKYLNPSKEEVQGNGTGSILFNIDFINPDNKVVITEGVFNTFHKTEDQYALCAVFGKAILFNQLKKIIKKKPSEIILAYDNDKYFLKSTKDSITFIKHETEIPVSVIDWSKYKTKEDKEPCDFGDLYKSYEELPIHKVSTFDFLKKFIL